MKIYLDLLPKEKKKELRRKKIFRLILRQEFLFLLPILIFIVILFNIFYLLSFQQQNFLAGQAMEQSQDKYQKLNTYEEKFKKINESTATLLKIQEGHLRWNNVFNELDSIAPEGVVITDFSTKDYAVFLVGKAKNRDLLLDFKGKLETDGCFSNVNVPLSNLVVKDDIDFQLDYVVNKECLKKK